MSQQVIKEVFRFFFDSVENYSFACIYMKGMNMVE